MAIGGDKPPLYTRRERTCLRVGSVNVNGWSALGNRKISSKFWERMVGRYGNTRNPYKVMWSDGRSDGE